MKAYLLERLKSKYAYLDKQLAGKKFLVGSSFTVADSYTYVVTTWAGYLGLKLAEDYPAVQAYQERIAALPAVKAAHERMAKKPATVC